MKHIHIILYQFPRCKKINSVCVRSKIKKISGTETRKTFTRYAAKSDKIVLCSRSECELFQKNYGSATYQSWSF